MKATARANANIALVKYWGKRNEALRLPSNGSISLTLEGLAATTTVEFDAALRRDYFVLDGVDRVGRESERVFRFLDAVRAKAGVKHFAKVDSRSDVPVGAGLASSASGFAALAVAASRAAGADYSARELSIFARKGSGSACRSIFGGFVEWRKGERTDGEDSYAEQLLPEGSWDVGMVIAVAKASPKDVGSTEGMERSTHAPGFLHWLATVDGDLAVVRRGIRERDLRSIGLVAEGNATKMHLAAASAGVVYWSETTVRLVKEVARLREEEGLEGYYTVDAGPNVAVLARAADLEAIAGKLRAVEGVERAQVHRAGPGAAVVEAT
ncbi:MAG TPA: diphosphomevalonate decarboxylase [Planctomycetota bacterium]|nr:diphosphomevalonate decarboxylase [Planctomycetota bacterium]